METSGAAGSPGLRVVELRDVSKSYGGPLVVRHVSLQIDSGSIHGLVGENGAGKSTLCNIIAGVTMPSSGELLVDGRLVKFRSPRQALGQGIAMIAQELALAPVRSVMANVFMGVEPRFGPMHDRRAQRREFDSLVERTGFDLPADALVGTLSIAEQQKVEILRAVARDARLIIMDEPTAPLTHVEAQQLFEIVRHLRATRGTTILYVSHFLEDVVALCDKVTVMRDGAHVSTRPAQGETPETLVESMLGRSVEMTFPSRTKRSADSKPVLEVRSISGENRFEDISFEVHPGEIVGISGLIGSGRTEVLRALFGVDRIDSGEVLLYGEPVRFRSPREAIRHGVVMLPEGRKEQGLVLVRSVAENVALADVSKLSSHGVLRRGRRREAVAQKIRELDIRARSQDMPVGQLSGGNQQKVLLAKCLMVSPRVLLIDEPTQGVDVGAKRAIYQLIVELGAQGMAVVLVSSELVEVLELAHRVLVMFRGRVAADMPAEEADHESVLAAAFGNGPPLATFLDDRDQRQPQ